MEAVTTYTVTGTNTNIIWVFKYHLNGVLAEFKCAEGELDARQINWLFKLGKFPYYEKDIKGWSCIKNFKIEVGEPDLSFEIFWLKYNHKIKRIDAEKFWNTMPIKDKKAAIDYLKTYDSYLQRKSVAKCNPHRYLNKRYWEDNHASIH